MLIDGPRILSVGPRGSAGDAPETLDLRSNRNAFPGDPRGVEPLAGPRPGGHGRRARHAEALRSMRAVWVDAGSRDGYYLDLGATAFRRALEAAGVPDERVCFELFDAGHGAIEYRHPLALAWLVRHLSA
ncbi:hypothetical protein [Nonomuraea sp. NPDC052265]|uniref:hypothetical protein n=1 Tax=Nonomuraea sp. NPDC052265 TaxID=3364374 RepID=UPI0037C7644B